ncbi:DUF3592 domain-containing protein [Ferruginibacter sp. HRS2-29]|uniref:DUF3592 domain-containing protein n=1 Tax=Ferruginibacter sp. HRS2-29 TaxID=2487334 RepID=UPI0020CD6808|nr:DUF3592 domain-containing protein [Ferruginibacter sp. HRS2-29]MCP9753523.1 hypothetical protein [Ferruginibacter sp. HRS2-29]
MKKLILFVSGLAITAWGLYISAKPLYIRLQGKTATGIVTALHARTRAGRNSSRNFFKAGRRPYICFLAEGKQDSTRFLAAGGGLFMDNYTAGEKVTVAYNPADASQHAVFSFTEMSSGGFAIFFGVALLFMVWKPGGKNQSGQAGKQTI